MMHPSIGHGLVAAGMVLIAMSGVDHVRWSRWYRGLAGTILAAAGFMIVWGQ